MDDDDPKCGSSQKAGEQVHGQAIGASSKLGYINIVLVGHTGNGKSATGNTILGRKSFTSMPSASSVSCTCELKSKVIWDGRTINVIDTQGFGDIVTDHELIIEELTKCFDLANNEIHAFLLVVSVRSRFSKEEAAAIRNLKTILGLNLVKYVIVVFTGGDDLDDQMKTLDDYLGLDCPVPLKEIIGRCGGRSILFDNRTKSESKKAGQVQQLIELIDTMILNNDGAPFKNNFYDLKKKNEELSARQIEIVNSCQRLPDMGKPGQANTSQKGEEVREGSAKKSVYSKSDASSINIVLVGQMGSGKSATGNTILGGRLFASRVHSHSVTLTCEMKSRQLSNGRTINVIDTKGFGDTFTQHELIMKNELTKCFDLANNEIHAFLLVVSYRRILLKEEKEPEVPIRNLEAILGTIIRSYVIVVITDGDDIDDQYKTSSNNDFDIDIYPDQLKVIIRTYGNRCILFDNRTKNGREDEQVQRLLSLVDRMIHDNNDGNPLKQRELEVGDQSRTVAMAAKKVENAHLNNQGKEKRKESNDDSAIEKFKKIVKKNFAALARHG